MNEKNSLLEGLKVEIDQEQVVQVVNVRSIPLTSEKIEKLEKELPEIKGMRDTIIRLKIRLIGSLLFEGTIRVGDKEIPFVNLVRNGEEKKDTREGVNIIFSPREGHQSYTRYKSAGKMVERYRYQYSANQSNTLYNYEGGKIEKDENYECDGEYRWLKISNDASTIRELYRHMVLGYNPRSYPEGKVIEQFVNDYDVSYSLVYPDAEAKIPVEILETVDEVSSVYVLGDNGKYEKVVCEEGVGQSESCEGQTLEEYLEGMKDKYGIEPVTAKDRDISFSDLSKYSIPEEIKKIVDACYNLRMKQKEENNIGKQE